jgi:FG-GAP repeat
MTLLRPLNTMARSFHGQGRAMSSNAGGMTALALAASIACSAAALASPAVAASRGIQLSDIAAGKGGFVINGQCAYETSGGDLSDAGDINGDGLADLIVGTPGSFTDAGHSYVVFGKTGNTAIDLSDIAAGRGGFVINGECAQDYSGGTATGAGDVNGDGLADLIVSASGSDPAAGRDAGRSYVVFGKTGTTAIDLSVPGTATWCSARPAVRPWTF